MWEPTASWYIGQMIIRAGISQKEAAARIGISSAYLSDILNGRRRVTPELAAAAVDKIETAHREAALLDLQYLGAQQDGWLVVRPDNGSRNE